MDEKTLSAKSESVVGVVISILITGFGIGWLIGLSVSPVVSIVITSVTGTAAAVITTLTGLDKSSRWSVNPWPMAILIIGILAGSTIGITARNQDWLARNMRNDAARWKQAGLELDEEQILARFFDSAYPQNGGSSGAVQNQVQLHSGTVLFAIGTEECTRLLAREGNGLIGEMRGSDQESVRKLPDIVDDPVVLKKMVEDVLCPNP